FLTERSAVLLPRSRKSIRSQGQGDLKGQNARPDRSGAANSRVCRVGRGGSHGIPVIHQGGTMNATLIVRRIAFATVLAAASAVTTPGSAAACTAKPDPFGALVGCCGDDGTPLADGATCVDESNPCRKNKCTAPTGTPPNLTPGTCTKNASYTATTGHPKCLNTADLCSVGECYAQACTYIGNQSANGFD